GILICRVEKAARWVHSNGDGTGSSGKRSATDRNQKRIKTGIGRPDDGECGDIIRSGIGDIYEVARRVDGHGGWRSTRCNRGEDPVMRDEATSRRVTERGKEERV